MNNTFKIDLENGKYTVHYEDGIISCDRYGIPWRKKDLLGDNLVHALVLELQDMYKELDKAVGIIVDQGVSIEELKDLHEQD